MNDLMRWNPRLIRRNLVNEFDQMVDEMMRFSGRDLDLPTSWGLALDVAENDDQYVIKASLPGVNPDDVEVTLENNVLSVAGEIKEEQENEGNTYHLRERRYGKFRRSITLPSRVEADNVDASYADGVLTIQVPKSEEVKPKRIEIKGAKKVLEAENK
jgi:HSP20 family protein